MTRMKIRTTLFYRFLPLSFAVIVPFLYSCTANVGLPSGCSGISHSSEKRKISGLLEFACEVTSIEVGKQLGGYRVAIVDSNPGSSSPGQHGALVLDILEDYWIGTPDDVLKKNYEGAYNDSGEWQSIALNDRPIFFRDFLRDELPHGYIVNASFNVSGSIFWNEVVEPSDFAGTNKRFLIVTSAGNSGSPNPQLAEDSFLRLAQEGWVVVAAGTNVVGGEVVRHFDSDACGFAKEYCIGAPYVPRSGYQGTSFSAPQVVAALSMILYRWPHLWPADSAADPPPTPEKLVSVLFACAKDTGIAGVDEELGHGLLSLDCLFTPDGSLIEDPETLIND